LEALMLWEPSFVAVGVLLGEPLGAMLASLASPVPAEVTRLVRQLQAPSRRARAQALAVALSDVARALEDARLA
jgi:hypothetical protein